MTRNTGRRLLALAISAVMLTACGKSSEPPQPTAEEIAKAVLQEMQASAEEQGMDYWKSVDSIAGTPEGTKAASFLDIRHSVPFYRVFVDEQGNLFLEDVLIPTPAALTERVRRWPSKEWRVVAHNDVRFDAIYPLLAALRAGGVTVVTFTAPSDAYQPPRIELGLKCEEAGLPRKTREICMDEERQARLYKEKGCCLAPDQNPVERSSPWVTLVKQEASSEDMPVLEVGNDGTVKQDKAVVAGIADIAVALRSIGAKEVVLRPHSGVAFKHVAPVLSAVAGAGVERIQLLDEPVVW